MRSRSLMTACMVYTVILAVISGALAQEPLPFAKALGSAVENHPRLKAAVPMVGVRKTAVSRARLWDTPSAEAEASGMSLNEVELRVGQKIPLGGKVKARVAIAEHDYAQESRGQRVVSREIGLGLIGRYIDVAVYEERAGIADSLLALTGTLAAEIARRVENGVARAADTIRIRMELNRLAIERDELRSMTMLARQSFAHFGAESLLLQVHGLLNHRIKLPPFDSATAMIDARPDREIALQSLVRFDLEDAAASRDRYPDIVAEAGFIHGREGSGTDPLLAFSLDFPLMKSAGLARESIASERLGTVMRLDEEKRGEVGELRELYSRFAVLERRQQSAEGMIVPENSALTAVLEEYYRAGNGSLMEVIDARREQMTIAQALLDNYEERARCALDVMRISGCTIDIITDGE